MPWFEEAWIPGGPDWVGLWTAAERQGGLITNAEARRCGVRRSLLSYHTRRGHIERVGRGVYRLRWPPPAPHDRIRVAWMAVGRDRAVVSHDSALSLWELLDDPPDQVHLTLPRSRRGKIPRAEPDRARRVCYHVPRQPLADDEIVLRHGIRVTTAERAILDTARTRADTSMVVEAVRRAASRGLIDCGRLRDAARRRGGRTRLRVDRGLRGIGDGAVSAVVAPRGAV